MVTRVERSAETLRMKLVTVVVTEAWGTAVAMMVVSERVRSHAAGLEALAA
jgi:hypothetical protein